MKAEKPDNQVVGNVGLYYVCYRLSMLGWNVMPTSRNARGVDLLIYNHDASITHSIQVKALSKASPVPLGKHLNNIFADFIIVCRKIADPEPECFVLVPDEIRSLAHRGEKAGKVSFWLQPRQYDRPEFKDAWDRVGRGDLRSKVTQATPI